MAKRQNSKSNESKHQPIEEVRIGSIKAAIWRNQGEQGVRYNVTFQRIYRTRPRASGRAPTASAQATS